MTGRRDNLFRIGFLSALKRSNTKNNHFKFITNGNGIRNQMHYALVFVIKYRIQGNYQTNTEVIQGLEYSKGLVRNYVKGVPASKT